MKRLKLLLILLLFVFAACYSYGEDWYEYEESSCSRPDYVGSTDMRVNEVSDDVKYTPEYTKNDLQETMIERDLGREVEVAQSSSESYQGISEVSDLGVIGLGNMPE